MKPRISFMTAAPAASRAMYALDNRVSIPPCWSSCA
jgi:hypothetical protein